MNMKKKLKQEIGEWAQFITPELMEVEWKGVQVVMQYT